MNGSPSLRGGKLAAPWIWAALLGSLWIVMILCTRWEPVMRDGWGNLHWHEANTLDLHAA